jgi:hypothetical protein
MVGVETPKSLAVRFIDRPLTYSSTAAAFRASGLPRGGRIGEVQAAAFAQVALLAAHQAVLDVLLAPAALAPKPHDQLP